MSSDFASRSTSGYSGAVPDGIITLGSRDGQRREDIDLQFREREQQLADMQHRQQQFVHQSLAGSSAAYDQAEADQVVTNQMEELKREMRELKAQQHQMIVEMNENKPPHYAE
jgi:hypothetical protein